MNTAKKPDKTIVDPRSRRKRRSLYRRLIDWIKRPVFEGETAERVYKPRPTGVTYHQQGFTLHIECDPADVGVRASKHIAQINRETRKQLNPGGEK